MAFCVVTPEFFGTKTLDPKENRKGTTVLYTTPDFVQPLPNRGTPTFARVLQYADNEADNVKCNVFSAPNPKKPEVTNILINVGPESWTHDDNVVLMAIPYHGLITKGDAPEGLRMIRVRTMFANEKNFFRFNGHKYRKAAVLLLAPTDECLASGAAFTFKTEFPEFNKETQAHTGRVLSAAIEIKYSPEEGRWIIGAEEVTVSDKTYDPNDTHAKGKADFGFDLWTPPKKEFSRKTENNNSSYGSTGRYNNGGYRRRDNDKNSDSVNGINIPKYEGPDNYNGGKYRGNKSKKFDPDQAYFDDRGNKPSRANYDRRKNYKRQG